MRTESGDPQNSGPADARTIDGEPIRPVFQLYMEVVDVYQHQFDFHRSAGGELVLVGSGGPAGTAIASDDEGRSWRPWPEIRTWPEGGIQAVARSSSELFLGGGDLRIWRSQDEGRTWSGGHPLLKWPNHVQVDGGEALLWTPTGDRIVVTRENRLLISVDFLMGGEGPGAELVGALASEDSGETWRLYQLFGPPPGYPDRPEGFGEPKLVELADGRVWMVFRTCLGHLWQAFSDDGGRTWGEPTATGLVSPLAPLKAQRVPDRDAVVVVWSCAEPSRRRHPERGLHAEHLLLRHRDVHQLRGGHQPGALAGGFPLPPQAGGLRAGGRAGAGGRMTPSALGAVRLGRAPCSWGREPGPAPEDRPGLPVSLRACRQR